jgi:hypothetical protein
LNCFWLVCHEFGNNAFRVYKIDSSGLDLNPQVFNIGSSHAGGTVGNNHGSLGQLTYCPQSGKLACAISILGMVEVFDFDEASGNISNPMVLQVNEPFIWGLAFSPTGSKLYYTVWTQSKIVQLDMNAGTAVDIVNSYEMVGTVPVSNPPYSAGYLANGPDGKIYVAQWNSTSVGRIENPELSAPACMFNAYAVTLSSGICKAGLCNVPFFRNQFLGHIENAQVPLLVFPNPVSDNQIRAACPDNHLYQYTIIDLNSRVCAKGFFMGNEPIKVSGLEPGAYSLLLIDSEGHQKTIRFIRQ